MDAHLYHVNIKWNQGRQGIMCSPELNTNNTSQGCIEVATPPEFPKGIAGIWSPEHLFTASIASCFMTTFLAIAESSKLDFAEFECRSTGKLEYVQGKPLMTEVALEPVVTILNDSDGEKANRILQKTEAACLISNSVKAAISMKPDVRLSAG